MQFEHLGRYWYSSGCGSSLLARINNTVEVGVEVLLFYSTGIVTTWKSTKLPNYGQLISYMVDNQWDTIDSS